jgi:hypothetical protein
MKQDLENRLRRLESAEPEIPAKLPELDWSNFTHAEAKMVLEHHAGRLDASLVSDECKRKVWEMLRKRREAQA